MLSFSRKLFHAIEAVTTLAYRVGNEPLSGKELCEKLGLPPRYLEAMMQQLVRIGILRGVRGPSGGYQLAKPPERISIADICRALAPEEELTESHTELGQRLLLQLSQDLELHSLNYLDTITLAMLCDKARHLHIKRDGMQMMDFTI